MFEWKYLFFNGILKRGFTIPYSTITIKSIDENGLTATIMGTSEYTVKIAGDFSEMSCSCPCDFNCKHEVALLKYCEEHEQSFFVHSEGSHLAETALRYKNQSLQNQAMREAKLQAMQAEQEMKKAQILAQQEAKREQELLKEKMRNEKKQIAAAEKARKQAEAQKKKEERERIKKEQEQQRIQKLQQQIIGAQIKDTQPHVATKTQTEIKKNQTSANKTNKKNKQHKVPSQSQLNKLARIAIDNMPTDIRKKFYASLRKLETDTAILEKSEREYGVWAQDKMRGYGDTGWYYDDIDGINPEEDIDGWHYGELDEMYTEEEFDELDVYIKNDPKH